MSPSAASRVTKPSPRSLLYHLTNAAMYSPIAMPSGTGGALGAVATAVDESTSSTFMTCQPLGPRTPAQVTVAPGLRSSCPAWRSVVTCRNASLLSASRAKNPYPLTALNHFTLPRSSTVPTSPPVSPCWVVIFNDPMLLFRNPKHPNAAVQQFL